MLYAEPEGVIHLPTNTYVPLVAAFFTLLFFSGILFQLYSVATAGALLAVASFFYWGWQTGDLSDPARVDAGHGLSLPLHHQDPYGPGWWGTLLGLTANAALYASLLFGYYFLWTVRPDWPPAGVALEGLIAPALGLGLLLASSVAVHAGVRALAQARPAGLQTALVLAVLLALGFLVAQWASMAGYAVPATEHAYSALVHVIVGYQILHVVLAMLMALFVIARVRAGYVGPDRQLAARVLALFWHYTVLAWVLGFVTVHLTALLL
jgi:cytochrome c oxidase subunit I+III